MNISLNTIRSLAGNKRLLVTAGVMIAIVGIFIWAISSQRPGFITKKTTLTVTSATPNTQVALDEKGDEIGDVPLYFTPATYEEITPGRHLLTASAVGFQTVRQFIEVKPQQDNTVNVVLPALPPQQQLSPKLPLETPEFNIVYLPNTTTFIVTIKQNPFQENKTKALKWFTDQEVNPSQLKIIVTAGRNVLEK